MTELERLFAFFFILRLVKHTSSFSVLTSCLVLFSLVQCTGACPSGSSGHPGLPGMKVSSQCDGARVTHLQLGLAIDHVLQYLEVEALCTSVSGLTPLLLYFCCPGWSLVFVYSVIYHALSCLQGHKGGKGEAGEPGKQGHKVSAALDMSIGLSSIRTESVAPMLHHYAGPTRILNSAFT